MVSTPHEAPSPESPLVPTASEIPVDGRSPIAIDNFSDDTNSQFDDDLSDLTSLSESVFEFEYENGRRYCSNRTNILDLGTGTGIWAMDIAEKFPHAHVIGNDISPIQPSWVAPNIEFIVEDFESEWDYERNHFDFIHARCLAGCVADWPGFIGRIYDHVKPGGYFESHESAVWARSDDGSLKNNSALMEWQQALNFAGEKIGRELNIYHKLKNWMIAAGFKDVSLRVYTLPFSPWPRDPHLKALGKYQAVQLQQAIDSYSLRLYTQVLGWGSDAAKIHNAVVKQELRDKRLHAAWEHPDAYVEALLGFSTTSVLFMNLCGGVHMVDFLTREPDLYTQTLPKEWISFFEQHDVQDIIRLLLREDIEHLGGAAEPSLDQRRGTWNGGAFPPQTLLEYISNVRLLTLQREMCPSSPERVELPKQVAMHMNRKKVHEVQCFSQHVASLSETVNKHRGEPVTHIVDFGSGQNYLGRTLASSPYYKHIIAIERKHQYINGAKSMDVRAKLAKNPKAQISRKTKFSCDGSDGTSEVTVSETTETSQPPTEDSQVSDVPLFEMGKISLQSDELAGCPVKIPQEQLPEPEIQTCGTLSYIEHEIQDGHLEPIIEHIIQPSPTGASDDKRKQDNDARVMVVSLHSCGNLVHHGLRSLTLNPSIVAVAMIGCCYNLLTERLGPTTHNLPILQSLHPRLKETGTSYDPHGFPMSKYYENYRSPGATTGMKLNITARALAVQAPYNWGVNDSEVSFTRHFFRALLQRILVDRGIIPKPSVPEDGPSDRIFPEARSIILGALPKAAFKSFTAYVRAATTKMSRDSIYGPQVQEKIATLTDEEIQCYETQYLHARKNMSVVWSLMAFSAQLVEAIIVVDRWQFLREQDLVKECWVEPVFDYSESPRNLAVIGLKK
ncbi:uncharacterized protein N7500_006084 [Penicillium coprophilum]|uniref:uncharacterized protein n=1 Tax=Penicillium coprophilum TaxID=36646 RepID=UPI00238CDD84|nr:uncharacterized protein N7500_006084 [Penicillium coprophilum]KAJ5164254.1 hypothetical protein N7500_006084 [Penicillium coprophilum]